MDFMRICSSMLALNAIIQIKVNTTVIMLRTMAKKKKKKKICQSKRKREC